ncbi:hypothetical protein NA57DRAFT_71948 [Rhizodiscina lignyota]|uniref:Uncharacterized protein n=1 Tax=Rhizodiscina lignyota TaxID=1504668 RepID=A0A9P4INW6_9PEZI|nr:hypothetical protein NA57DRAFT_71948 [Rhizodiscina lignyota]
MNPSTMNTLTKMARDSSTPSLKPPLVAGNVKIINISASGKIQQIVISRKKLIDFSRWAEEELEGIPMRPMVELRLPHPVVPAALAIVVNWMNKVWGKRPTTPIAISDIQDINYDKALLVYQIIHMFDIKARAVTTDLYPWFTSFFKEGNKLTAYQIWNTWHTFRPNISIVSNMTRSVARRGWDDFPADEQVKLEELGEKEPEFLEQVHEHEQKYMEYLERVEKRAQRAEAKAKREEQQAKWAAKQARHQAYQGKKQAVVGDQHERRALAADGQQLLSDKDAFHVMRGGVAFATIVEPKSKTVAEAA